MALKLEMSALAKLATDSEKKHTILVVDDEASNLRAMAASLKDEYEVLTASSGHEALTLITSLNTPEKIHLIITDQRMPELTGVEFLEKTIAIIPETMRIILTGFSDINDVIASINQGQVHRFMTKPATPQTLLANTRKALSIYELKERNAQLADALRTAYVHQNTLIEQERSRFAEALHNDALQALGLLEKYLNQEHHKKDHCGSAPDISSCWFDNQYAELISKVHAIEKAIRDVINALHPQMLKDLGLVPALRNYIKQLNQKIPAALEFNSCSRIAGLPFEAELMLFRVAQEGINNLLKHSQVTHGQILLNQNEKLLWLQIEDQGKGFDLASTLGTSESQGHGLFFMQENALQIGGTLNIHSKIDEGTSILLEIPMPWKK